MSRSCTLFLLLATLLAPAHLDAQQRFDRFPAGHVQALPLVAALPAERPQEPTDTASAFAAFISRTTVGTLGMIGGTVVGLGAVFAVEAVGGSGDTWGTAVGLSMVTLISGGAGVGVAAGAGTAQRHYAWAPTLLGAAVGATPAFIAMAQAGGDDWAPLLALLLAYPGSLFGALAGNYLGQ